MTRQANRIKRIISEGGIAIGASVGNFTGPTIVELIGLAGFDAVSIDMQHSGLSLEQILTMVVVAERMELASVVRIPSLDPPLITRLLDIGVQGIRLAGIKSAEEARRLVDATRFPPLGSRSLIGNSRAVQYAGAPSAETLEKINREIFIWVSIEDLQGVEAIDEIARIDGIDSIGVGPHDLASQLGVVGEPDPPALRDAIQKVVEVVSASGKGRLSIPFGNPMFPRSPKELLDLGVGYALCLPFPEIRLLRSLRETVTQFRSLSG